MHLFISVLKKTFLGGKTRCSNAASDECYAGVPGVGGRHKTRKIVFCWAEAVRERLLQHLQSARSLTFQPRHGLLGTQSFDDDNSATGLALVIL